MANSPGQTTSLTSNGHEASLKACRRYCDRISDLQDALTLQILSFLPTKQAVATSVLSKRWVRLWTLVPNFDLQDSEICRIDEQAKQKFVHIVYRVLLLNKAGFAEKFRLHCIADYGQPFISTWICSAMERGLQQVDISFSETNSELKKLPSGLFLMKTLKILKLHGYIMVDVPVSVCLPSLKILHLLWVSYANVKSVNCLISGCPNLEELRIDAFIRLENMVHFNISTPTLNSLSLDLRSCRDIQYLQKRVEINTPCLKYLNLSFYGHRYIVKTFPSLVDANISILGSYGTEEVRVLNGVKCLKLRGSLEHFALPPARRSFPSFVNLTQLQLHGKINLVVALLFLQNSPRLKTLAVHDEASDRLRRWELPKLVPICLETSLKRARFNFEGLEGELEMVEYILKNAKVLRTMEIYTGNDLSSDSKLCLLKKLSMLPRSSETCQLSFD
ncbi:hypothetical protein PTKIN_Ptkin14bG0123600 [Pterospermum kingtungense]